MQMSEVDILLDQALTAKSVSEEIEYVDIDPDKRVIDAKGLLLGVQSDEKSERIYFKIPKYVGDRLDLMNTQYKLFINYENAEGVRDVYWITDRATDGEYVTFSWLLSRLATNVRGTVKFSLCVKRVHTDGTITNEWNTTIAIGEVLDGLEASEVVAEYCSDVITLLVTKVDQLEIDVDNLETAVDNLEDKVDKNLLKNRNLLREEWLTTHEGFSDSGGSTPYHHYIDKMNYVLDGTCIYSKHGNSDQRLGFYCNNIEGMARSTDYVVKFKARRKKDSPKIIDVSIYKGVNHTKTRWSVDGTYIGDFSKQFYDGKANVSVHDPVIDDFEWHEFVLEFTTSNRPAIIQVGNFYNQQFGDVIAFNGDFIRHGADNEPRGCDIDIAELQWKKADDHLTIWSRAPEDVLNFDINPLWNPNASTINLMREEWLQHESTSNNLKYNSLDKSYYHVNRSFTYNRKYDNNSGSRGFRINHIDGMNPSTKYIIHFKMRRITQKPFNMVVSKNFNHTVMKWFMDGVEMPRTNAYISVDLSDNLYHDFLIEFTTAESIQMRDNSYPYVSDTISIYSGVEPNCAVNIIDFIWIDVSQENDLYETLLFNRYIFKNRNFLRDEWLTGYELEV